MVHLPWYNIRPFNEEGLQLPHANFKVRITELVGNVPSERAKLDALLDRSVEKAQTEQHFPPCEGLVTFNLIEKLRVVDGVT